MVEDPTTDRVTDYKEVKNIKCKGLGDTKMVHYDYCMIINNKDMAASVAQPST